MVVVVVVLGAGRRVRARVRVVRVKARRERMRWVRFMVCGGGITACEFPEMEGDMLEWRQLLLSTELRFTLAVSSFFQCCCCRACFAPHDYSPRDFP